MVAGRAQTISMLLINIILMLVDTPKGRRPSAAPLFGVSIGIKVAFNLY